MTFIDNYSNFRTYEYMYYRLRLLTDLVTVTCLNQKEDLLDYRIRILRPWVLFNTTGDLPVLYEKLQLSDG